MQEHDQKPRESPATALFRKLDRNRDGVITKEEFLTGLQEIHPAATPSAQPLGLLSAVEQREATATLSVSDGSAGNLQPLQNTKQGKDARKGSDATAAATKWAERATQQKIAELFPTAPEPATTSPAPEPVPEPGPERELGADASLILDVRGISKSSTLSSADRILYIV